MDECVMHYPGANVNVFHGSICHDTARSDRYQYCLHCHYVMPHKIPNTPGNLPDTIIAGQNHPHIHVLMPSDSHTQKKFNSRVPPGPGALWLGFAIRPLEGME